MKKLIVITGASDGIGAEAARELSKRGNDLVIIGRSIDKTKKIAQELNAKFYISDFSRLSDVKELADNLNNDLEYIDVLINNAGGIFKNHEITIDGHEKTFQVNYLSHFLLTNLLLEKLTHSKASVINTSSIASRVYGNIDLNDLELKDHFNVDHAYGNSKLENILFTQELHRRYHDKGISTAAVHPGTIATNFANDTTSWMQIVYRSFLSKLFLQSPKKGAEPLVWLASSTPDTDWKSGYYYEKLELGVLNPQALDPQISNELWGKSMDFISPFISS